MKNKSLYLITLLLSLSLVLTACNNTDNAVVTEESEATEMVQTETEAPVEEESETEATANEESESEESEAENSEEETEESSDTIVVEDMNGRSVEIPSPENIDTAYSLNTMGQLLIYTINPDFVPGTTVELREEELKYLPEAADLEVLGTYGHTGQDVNPETFLEAGVDVFIYSNLGELNEENAAAADTMQEDIQVPVLVIDTSFENRGDAYRFLGEVLGEEERANELADYCDNTFEEVTSVTSEIPEEEKVTLYYAEGDDGLATDPEDSFHAAVYKYAGANNVADVEVTPVKGMTPVSLEQILEWNPEYIFMRAGNGSPYEEITSNPNWANIQAVADDNVYEVPRLPFSWVDRPPSAQQSLGLKFVANILYPDLINYDMVQETQEFYQLFYNYEMGEEEANEIMGITNE